MTSPKPQLSVRTLVDGYADGRLHPRDVIDQAFARIESPSADPAVWLHRLTRKEAYARAGDLERRRAAGAELPLFGVPIAVKDNIDVAGMPTTAACPAFSYTPTVNAEAVERLVAAGAIVIGKTNLDQFATGLVGTRSPHGSPRSVYNREFISGGSSAGSAVAVAAGQVAAALGTDTAGSGRVPAAFNGIVGLKPTRGLVSTRGVVPACRSLDCVSIFAPTADDASLVLAQAAGYDPLDPYSRCRPDSMDAAPTSGPVAFSFGVPATDQLDFLGDAEAARLFDRAIERLIAIGGEPVEIDFEPFVEAGELLYSGPWIAERDVAFGDFIRRNPGSVDPVVLGIVSGAAQFNATDTFRALQRLQELRRAASHTMTAVEFMVAPTTPTTYTVDAILADPVRLNSNLGRYTNFMNLLDLAGVALPAGFRENGAAAGVTIVGRPFSDDRLCAIGMKYGALYRREVEPPPLDERSVGTHVRLAVVGAHLRGQPLNHELTSRGARFVCATRTARTYRLFALAGTHPPKPGLVRAGDSDPGTAIEVEVWELALAEFGSFVRDVPAPLAIGTVELEDATSVKGFVCEPPAVDGAEEITHLGGWRAYREQAAG